MKRLLVSGLLVLLFVSMLFTTPTKAAVVWSDNFDDGNLDGWTISGTSRFSTRTPAVGNFSVADKTLRSTGLNLLGHWSFATHPTMTTTGTWSWDLYFNKEGTINYETGLIDWIDKPIVKQPFDWNGYAIDIRDEGVIEFSRIMDGGYTALYPKGDFQGYTRFMDPHRRDSRLWWPLAPLRQWNT